ncbi:Mas-related G-protein coupled receptor member D [Heyndrickxia sp. FSL K6-6286]|uniref:Mas-related G-protein coupled receptor member D n=1 Tax=Heyndrickxia sp. FSL K6-6286 TaxID=2921510 RepID=UPI00315AB9A6
MEAFYFSLAFLCFGISIMIFIELLLNSGLKEALDISKKSVKLMVGIFIMYVLSFSSYILYQVL